MALGRRYPDSLKGDKMKPILVGMLLLGGLLIRETLADPSLTTPVYCTTSTAQGKVRYVFSPNAFTDGRILVKLESWDHSDNCGAVVFNLVPSVVGSQRFDLMYTGLMSAVANNLVVYIEYDPGNNNLLAVSVYNPFYTP
jgi:hypothetical protein